jgi:hypothetical protein
VGNADFEVVVDGVEGRLGVGDVVWGMGCDGAWCPLFVLGARDLTECRLISDAVELRLPCTFGRSESSPASRAMAPSSM